MPAPGQDTAPEPVSDEPSTVLARLEAIAGRRLRVLVPELGDAGRPLVVYGRLLSAHDMGEVAQTLESGDDPMIWSRIVYRLAETEDGRPLFRDVVDFARFRRLVPQHVAHRVGAVFFTGTAAAVEAAPGN